MGSRALLVVVSLLCPRAYVCLDDSCSRITRGLETSGVSLLQRRAALGRDFTTGFARFPFDLVLWRHVPKTAGTSMRQALVDLCKARGQKLQICYDVNCSASGTSTSALMTLEDNIMPWSKRNAAANQVVFGHGVRANFHRTWGLSPSPRLAHVSVFREPMSMLVSAWAHQNRDPHLPNYNMSLDEWIQQGKAEAFADYYASFYVDIEAPDPWNLDSPDARRPFSGIPILASIPNWREIMVAAVEAPNSLVLLQDIGWDTELARLATFLKLTSVERDNMLKALNATFNKAPKMSIVHVQKHNLDRLTKATEPLEFLYARAGMVSHAANASFIGSSVLPAWQNLSEENATKNSMVALKVLLD